MAKLRECVGDRKTKTKSPLEICSFSLHFGENRKKEAEQVFVFLPIYLHFIHVLSSI